MIEVAFWTFIHHELVIVFQIQVDLLMSVYKLDSRLSPICDLTQDFMSTLPLKDLQLVADDIDSVSKILMMLYIAGYKSRFIACSVEQYLRLIIYKSPHKNIIHKIMEDVYMSIPVGKWRIALYKKILSNLCVGTCLFEPMIAMPLKSKMDKKKCAKLMPTIFFVGGYLLHGHQKIHQLKSCSSSNSTTT